MKTLTDSPWLSHSASPRTETGSHPFERSTAWLGGSVRHAVPPRLRPERSRRPLTPLPHDRGRGNNGEGGGGGIPLFVHTGPSRPVPAPAQSRGLRRPAFPVLLPVLAARQAQQPR